MILRSGRSGIFRNCGMNNHEVIYLEERPTGESPALDMGQPPMASYVRSQIPGNVTTY